VLSGARNALKIFSATKRQTVSRQPPAEIGGVAERARARGFTAPARADARAAEVERDGVERRGRQHGGERLLVAAQAHEAGGVAHAFLGRRVAVD
jgi:hypothetical protein